MIKLLFRLKNANLVFEPFNMGLNFFEICGTYGIVNQRIFFESSSISLLCCVVIFEKRSVLNLLLTINFRFFSWNLGCDNKKALSTIPITIPLFCEIGCCHKKLRYLPWKCRLVIPVKFDQVISDGKSYIKKIYLTTAHFHRESKSGMEKVLFYILFHKFTRYKNLKRLFDTQYVI